MSLTDGERENLTTIIDAAKSNRLALMECLDKSGNRVAVICAVNPNIDGTDVEFVPMGRLFDGDPYEELVPPTSEEPTPEAPH